MNENILRGIFLIVEFTKTFIIISMWDKTDIISIKKEENNYVIIE